MAYRIEYFNVLTERFAQSADLGDINLVDAYERIRERSDGSSNIFRLLDSDDGVIRAFAYMGRFFPVTDGSALLDDFINGAVDGILDRDREGVIMVALMAYLWLEIGDGPARAYVLLQMDELGYDSEMIAHAINLWEGKNEIPPTEDS